MNMIKRYYSVKWGSCALFLILLNTLRTKHFGAKKYFAITINHLIAYQVRIDRLMHMMPGINRQIWEWTFQTTPIHNTACRELLPVSEIWVTRRDICAILCVVKTSQSAIVTKEFTIRLENSSKFCQVGDGHRPECLHHGCIPLLPSFFFIAWRVVAGLDGTEEGAQCGLTTQGYVRRKRQLGGHQSTHLEHCPHSAQYPVSCRPAYRVV